MRVRSIGGGTAGGAVPRPAWSRRKDSISPIRASSMVMTYPPVLAPRLAAKMSPS
jgi:hypothetical protein